MARTVIAIFQPSYRNMTGEKTVNLNKRPLHSRMIRLSFLVVMVAAFSLISGAQLNASSNRGCTTTGTPTGFTLQGVLNPVQPNGAALITTLTLGNAMRVRPLDLDGNGTVDTLVAFVTSGNQSGTANPGTYVFFLDPATGLPQANNPVTTLPWQNPLLVLSGVQSRHVAAGDVNGDRIPDFVLGSPEGGVAYLFVGAVSGSPSYTPSYTAYKISPPAGAPSTWARTVALGDLDGDGGDEIAVAAVPGSKQKVVPAVYTYTYTGSGVTPWGPGKIQDPTGSFTSDFGGGLNGGAVAIGNITGSGGNDLAVGADGGGTNGLVYVFPYPASQSNSFTLTGPGSGFGGGVGIADVNLDGFPDLVVNSGGSSGESVVFAGVVRPAAVYTNQLLPANGVGMGQEWAWPGFDVGNLQTVGAVAIGTLSASQTNACTVGAVQLFTSPYGSSQQPNYVFEPPSLVGSSQYGYNIGLVPGFPFILISAHYDNVGTTSGAGQVFVYKKN